MRLFTAIEIPESVREAIALASQGMKAACLQASWVRMENLHVTLKFLGKVPESQVANLCDALKRVSAVGTARVHVADLEFFPSRGPVRVIALGLKGQVELIYQVFQETDRTIAEIGFPSEGRRFVPHITLARARKTIHVSARKTLAPLLRWTGLPPAFEITSFSLIESRLKSGGPEYLRLATFPTK